MQVNNSPLGQYAPLVAALVCAGTIGVYLLAVVFAGPLALTDQALTSLHDLAVLAFGAVVGSAVAVNGWKQPLASAHERIDKLETAVNVEAASGAITTHEVPS